MKKTKKVQTEKVTVSSIHLNADEKKLAADAKPSEDAAASAAFVAEADKASETLQVAIKRLISLQDEDAALHRTILEMVAVYKDELKVVRYFFAHRKAHELLHGKYAVGDDYAREVLKVKSYDYLCACLNRVAEKPLFKDENAPPKPKPKTRDEKLAAAYAERDSLKRQLKETVSTLTVEKKDEIADAVADTKAAEKIKRDAAVATAVADAEKQLRRTLGLAQPSPILVSRPTLPTAKEARTLDEAFSFLREFVFNAEDVKKISKRAIAFLKAHNEFHAAPPPSPKKALTAEEKTEAADSLKHSASQAKPKTCTVPDCDRPVDDGLVNKCDRHSGLIPKRVKAVPTGRTKNTSDKNASSQEFAVVPGEVADAFYENAAGDGSIR